MLAVGTNQHRTGGQSFFFQGRIGAVDEQHGTHRPQVARGAERHRAVFILRRPVDPGTLGAVEGHLFAVHRKEVLSGELTQMLEQIAEPADDGKVAPHGMGSLAPIYDIDHCDDQYGDGQQGNEDIDHEVERGHGDSHIHRR